MGGARALVLALTTTLVPLAECVRLAPGGPFSACALRPLVAYSPRHPLVVADEAASADQITCKVRKQPKSSVALDISMPAKVADSVHRQVVQAFAKQAKVPGFRPGKAPESAVIAKIGAAKVKEATVEQLVDVGMKKAGEQVNLPTCGDARLDRKLEALAGEYTVGGPLTFTVLVDVYPEVKLEASMYEGLEVSVERVEFNQEAYDASVAKLREQHADLVDAPDGSEAALGEQLLVNMNGFSVADDGSKGPPLPAVAAGDGIPFPLKEGTFIPGMVEELVGVKAGETREMKVTFPSRTSAKQLAGKDAIFEVEVLKVQRRVLLDIGDEFAKKVAGMTWEELDAKLREGVTQEGEALKQKRLQRELEMALLDKLPDDLEVPESLLEQVSKERFASMLADMREQGQPEEEIKEMLTAEKYATYCKVAAPSSAKQVKADFALKEVSRQQNIEVTRDAIDEEMMSMRAQASQRGEKFKESEVRPRVAAALERGKVLDYLESKAVITEVEPGSKKEATDEEILGASPEELAASIQEEGAD